MNHNQAMHVLNNGSELFFKQEMARAAIKHHFQDLKTQFKAAGYHTLYVGGHPRSQGKWGADILVLSPNRWNAAERIVDTSGFFYSHGTLVELHHRTEFDIVHLSEKLPKEFQGRHEL